ncbi:MAG: 30S ribosomal protein S4 [DPANN group archaeon]|nr:30S ribosomal protein S4 [DPANN group archaeon]
MGDPRKSKRIYSRPTRPYDKDRITAEKITMKEFGLRRKNEIYKAEAFIRDIKRRARESIALKDEEVEKTILNKVTKLNLLGNKEANIDAILNIDMKAYLERRLETQVVRRELANSFLQARQFIVHGHIFVNNVKVTSPQYIVCSGEEDLISYNSRSVLVSSFSYGPKKIKERKEFAGGRKPFGGRGGSRPPFQNRTGNAQAGTSNGGVKK